jgi:hypothetical protein
VQGNKNSKALLININEIYESQYDPGTALALALIG